MPSRYNLEQKAITRGSILQAFVELTHEKRTTIISITDLCRKAGTSRMAFYRHFDNVRDVLLYCLEEWKYQLLNTFDSFTDRSWRELGLLFLDFAEKERTLLQAVFRDGYSALLTEFIVSGIELFNTRYYPRPYESDLAAKYAARFEAGGMIAVLSEWFSRECIDSKEEIIMLVLRKAGIPSSSPS